MRLAVFSDSHLGNAQYNLVQRFLDFNRAFEYAVNLAEENGADIVLYAGDMFDKHIVHPAAKYHAIVCLEKLRARGIPFLTVEGNHEVPKMFRYGKETEVQALERVGLVKILAPDKPYELDDVRIVGSGYTDDGKGLIPILKDKANPHKKLNVLVLHQDIAEFLPESVGEKILSLADIAQLPYNLVINGHLHTSSLRTLNGKKLLIPGSTERWSVSETEDKFVWFVDWDGRDLSIWSKKIEVVRPVAQVIIDCTNKKSNQEIVNEILDRLKGTPKEALINVVLEGVVEELIVDFQSIEQSLGVFAPLYVRITPKIRRKVKRVQYDITQLKSLKDLAIRYIEEGYANQKDILIDLFSTLYSMIVEHKGKPEEVAQELVEKVMGEGGER